MNQVYQYLTIALFVLSIPFLIYWTWRLLSVGRAYSRKKKELEKTINEPGMEDIRYFFKHSLKDHGISTRKEDIQTPPKKH